MGSFTDKLKSAKLTELGCLVIDCQSTGANPEHGQLLEISWRLIAPQNSLTSSQSSVTSYIVALAKDTSLAPHIRRLTGITDTDFERAVAKKFVRKKLQEVLASCRDSDVPVVCVIHFARFEKAFLDDLLKCSAKKPFPLPVICTHEIARRIHPDLPSRGIRALSGFYDLPLSELKRSHSHVEATVHIWQAMQADLAKHGVQTIADFEAWMNTKAAKRQGPRTYPLAKELRLSLPSKPGIYRMIGAQSQILYIGKATSLKSRVNSYFRGEKGRQSRQLEMLTQVKSIDFTSYETALEAALGETDEIKTIAPPYNIALRKTDHTLVFVAKDLSSFSETRNHEHPLGPFLTRNLAAFLALHEFIRTKVVPVEAFFGIHDAKLLRSGLRLFTREHKLKPRTSRRQLLAFGLWQLRRKVKERAAQDARAQKELEEAADEILAENETREFEWTKDNIASAFLGIAIGTASHYLRSKRIWQLSGSSVAWKLSKRGKRWRLLQLKHGDIVGRKTVKDLADHLESFIFTPSAAFDALVYDRMRVMDTEIAKLKSKGFDVRIVSH